MLLGVEGHIHGTAGDHRLVARRTNDLIGGQEIEAFFMVAESSGGFKCRKEAGLVRKYAGHGQEECTNDAFANGHIYTASLTA